jgi:hypothetical protein
MTLEDELSFGFDAILLFVQRLVSTAVESHRILFSLLLRE